MPKAFKQQSLGTGFIIDPAGYILTNNHVVAQTDQISVRLEDQKEFRATIRRGDVILSFDGKDVKKSSELPYIVAATPVGKRVGGYAVAG